MPPAFHSPCKRAMALATSTMRPSSMKCVRVRSPAAVAPRGAVVVRAAQVQKRGLEAVNAAEAGEWAG